MYPFPHYGDFTAFTPVVPELYWNVYSAEERIKALCMEWVKLTAFTDAMVDTVNEQYAELKDDIQARYDALDAAVDNIDDVVTQMQAQFPQLVNEQVNAEIRRLITSGEFQEILQAAIDEYWTQYGQRLSSVETNVQTLSGDLTAERNARIADDAQIREDFTADIASVNATLTADVSRLELQDDGLAARISTNENAIDEINKAYPDFITLNVPDENFAEIGTLSIPANHTCQGTVYISGYLYVLHHVNDDAPMFIERFNYPELTSTGSIRELPAMHGNGMDYDAVNDRIVIFDTKTSSIYFLDKNTLEITKQITSQTGNISAGSFNNKIACLNITGTSAYMLMERQNDNSFCTYGITQYYNYGAAGRQDMTCVENNMFAHLCGYVNDNYGFTRNIIALLKNYGSQYCIFKLPYVENSEFEGLAYVSSEKSFIVIDTNRKVYVANCSNYITSRFITESSENKILSNYKPNWILPNNAGLAAAEIPPIQFEYNGTNISVARFIRFPNVDFSNRYSRTPVLFGMPDGVILSGGTTGTGALRLSGGIVGANENESMYCNINYNINTETGLYYLATIDAINLRNSSKNAHFVSPYSDSETEFINKYKALIDVFPRLKSSNRFGPYYAGLGYCPYAIIKAV